MDACKECCATAKKSPVGKDLIRQVCSTFGCDCKAKTATTTRLYYHTMYRL